MASSQYVSQTTHGTLHESLHQTTNSSSLSALQSPVTSAASVSSPKGTLNLPPITSKLPSFAPHTQLTGAAALAARSPRTMADEDKRKVDNDAAAGANIKQSPNPAAGLLNPSYPVSRLTDAPPKEMSTTVSQALGGLPSIATAAAAMDTSGGLESNTLVGSGTVTAGPSNTDPALLQPEGSQYQPLQPQPQRTGSISEHLSGTTPTTPGFSHNPTTPSTPFSPSAGSGTRTKHTCPHCNQTFTRHHNLKSHLLTHSHEKPFQCQECQARFRRLHDLKRHSKLHTGERPHVCTKCDRRFARGDALARHARGEGGCAGRRSSMGGMLNEDGTMVSGMGSGDGDDGMEGLEGLIGDADGDVSMMNEGQEGSDGSVRRRASLPSIRTDFHPGHQPQSSQGAPITPSSGYVQHHHHHHQHSTYPPPQRTASTSGPSPSSGGLFPPHHLHQGGFKPTTPTSMSPNMQTPVLASATSAPSPAPPPSAGGQSILSPHGVLTDSPRPVSPAILPSQPEGHSRERTPSFGGGGFLGTSPPPHPMATSARRETEGIFMAHSQQHQRQQTAAPSSNLNQQASQQPSAPPMGSGPAPQANMGSGSGSGSGAQGNNLFSAGMEGVWAYIRSLEERIKELEEKNSTMEARQNVLEMKLASQSSQL